MGRRHQRRADPVCRSCGAPLIFARITKASIALDPAPADDGAVAAYVTGTGSRAGRWLTGDEQPLGYERRYRVHRCPPKNPRPAPQPDLFSTIEEGLSYGS